MIHRQKTEREVYKWTKRQRDRTTERDIQIDKKTNIQNDRERYTNGQRHKQRDMQIDRKS